MAQDRIKLGAGTWDSALNIKAQIPVNIGAIDRTANEANVQASNQGQITAYVQLLTNEGFNPTNLGSVPEPPPPTPTPPPTPDEITRDQEVATAFNTIIEGEIARIRALVETEYNNISTTAEPFIMGFDIKHLRQRASV